MNTVINYYIRDIGSEPDDNARLVAIIHTNKEIIKSKIEENIRIRAERPTESIKELHFRYEVIEFIRKDSCCRILPMRIIVSDDSIYTLVLVTNKFYFYQKENSEYYIRFSTQGNKYNVATNAISLEELKKEMSEIIAGKKPALFASEDFIESYS